MEMDKFKKYRADDTIDDKTWAAMTQVCEGVIVIPAARLETKAGVTVGYRFAILSVSEHHTISDLVWEKMVSVFPEITQTVSLKRDGNWEIECQSWHSQRGGTLSRYCGVAKASQSIGGAIREMMYGFEDVYERAADDVDFLDHVVGVIYC